MAAGKELVGLRNELMGDATGLIHRKMVGRCAVRINDKWSAVSAEGAVGNDWDREGLEVSVRVRGREDGTVGGIVWARVAMTVAGWRPSSKGSSVTRNRYSGHTCFGF